MNVDDIALVGLACRFPGARNAGEFWRNLREGREASTELSEHELRAVGVPEAELAHPTYVRTAFALDGADEFDARFFGVSADEARLTDPQQRVLLEVAYEALEDAAHVVRAQRSATGVFATAGGVTTSYLQHFASRFAAQPHGTGSVVQLGNDKDFLATKLAFKLNLTGPSLSVQTACSSSLVALHLARTSLLLGEIDLAVVGASCVRVPLRAGYVAAESPILSPVGKCKAFADDADGTVFGSGVGAVVLKRHADARRDGDNVYALLKSTAVTNDGAAKIGYTASSVPGQARAMAHAIAAAGVNARDISYVECHGTATRIGDPLEAKALERVFRLDTADRQFCGIGSVKTNIGHLEQAAGMASLIKVALMLRHRTLVPSINYDRPNPKMDIESSPFFVVRETRDWSAGEGAAGPPRVAAINCLGIGGTNAFAVLADAAPPDAPPPPRAGATPAGADDLDLVCVSAKTHDQLREYLERLADYLESRPAVRTHDFCYTVNVSRSHHRVRFCAVLSGEFARPDALRAGGARREPPANALAKETVYVCNPARTVTAEAADAFRSDPRFRAFRASFDDLSTRLHALLPHPPPGAADALRTLAFEVALRAQLVDWGVVAKDVIGVGFGRLVQAVAEAPDPGAVLPWVLARLGDELTPAMVRESRSPGAPTLRPPPGGGEPDAPAGAALPDARAAAPYVVSRCALAHPNGAAPGSAKQAGAAIEHGDRPLDKAGLLQFLARHLELGRGLDWESYYRDVPSKVLSVPTYPFVRERHWIGD